MHPVDAKIMNINKALQNVAENSDKEKLIKLYLLDCCEKLVRFRSRGCLAKNLLIARRFVNGFANYKTINRASWQMEGDAFGTEFFSEAGVQVYFRVNKSISADLLKVRISKGLTNKESRRYLIEMAYFISRVFSHVEYPPNWLFGDKCEQFMCPRLYSKYFGVAA
jgi:hypothetical protein